MNIHPDLVSPELLSKLRAQFKITSPIENSLVIQHDKPESSHILFSSIIHGNEILGVHLIKYFLECLVDGSIQHQNHLIFIWGNIPAYLLGQRLVDNDLNRSFLVDQPSTSEQMRAKDISTLASQSDLTIDLHQTTAESATPFFLFKYSDLTYQMAKTIDPNFPIMVYTSNKLHTEGASFSQFSIKNNIPHITLEMGQAGFDQKQFDHFSKCLTHFISTKLSEIKNRLMDVNTENNIWQVKESISKVDDAELIPGLKNFEILKKGTHLYTLNGQKYIMLDEGAILFPKYGVYRKHSNELCRILEKVPIKNIK
jgi:succinylglutamate desuccinylase